MLRLFVINASLRHFIQVSTTHFLVVIYEIARFITYQTALSRIIFTTFRNSFLLEKFENTKELNTTQKSTIALRINHLQIMIQFVRKQLQNQKVKFCNSRQPNIKTTPTLRT